MRRIQPAGPPTVVSLAVTLLATLLLTSACAFHFPGPFKERSVGTRWARMKPNGVDVYRRELPYEAGRITFELSGELREGTLVLQVEDPNGRHRWQRRIEQPGPLDEREWFHGMDGSWALKVYYEDSVGRYRVKISTVQPGRFSHLRDGSP